MDSNIYKNMFQSFPRSRLLFEIEKDNTVRIKDANRAAGQYFECEATEMQDRTPDELFEKSVADHIIQSCKSCAKTGKSVSIHIAPNFLGGVKIQTFLLNPIFSQDTQNIAVDMVAWPDENDTHHIERERDDAMLLLTSLFDATGVGIVVTDNFGRVVQINETLTRDYGWTQNDVLNREFIMFMPPEERSAARKLHTAFIDRGKSGMREIQVLRKDGQLRDIYLTTVLLELSQNRRFVVSTLKDITERKNMMRNLQHAKEQSDAANRAKSAFLANMSHELRTPLNAVIGFTEMMRNETYGPIGNEKYTEYLADIHFSARHLLEIINDVLDMSKIEAGKLDLVESDLDLNEVFRSVEMIMCERAERASVVLRFHVDPAVQSLKADQRLLRQMLINLIANAIKFSGAGDTVHISAAPMEAQKYLRITIEDHGCGIPHNQVNKVLEPFGQIHDPTKSRGQGTGLGLPLARAMVALHGGELSIETRKDIGTKVHLDFPIERTLTAIRKRLEAGNKVEI